jgi:hypothetical protein
MIMKKWITPVLLVLTISLSFTASSCNRNGCPAEIQAKKVKKKKSLSKKSTTNLFPKKMRKNVKNPKF